jgi:hypothetical protein
MTESATKTVVCIMMKAMTGDQQVATGRWKMTYKNNPEYQRQTIAEIYEIRKRLYRLNKKKFKIKNRKYYLNRKKAGTWNYCYKKKSNES